MSIEPKRHIFKVCMGCNKSSSVDVKFKVCSACKVVAYCSIECQKKHWSYHKNNCGKTPFDTILKRITNTVSKADRGYLWHLATIIEIAYMAKYIPIVCFNTLKEMSDTKDMCLYIIENFKYAKADDWRNQMPGLSDRAFHILVSEGGEHGCVQTSFGLKAEQIPVLCDIRRSYLNGTIGAKDVYEEYKVFCEMGIPAVDSCSLVKETRFKYWWKEALIIRLAPRGRVTEETINEEIEVLKPTIPDICTITHEQLHDYMNLVNKGIIRIAKPQ